MALKGTTKRLWKKFQSGPGWTRIPAPVLLSKYRSVTVMSCVWAWAFFRRWLTPSGGVLVFVSGFIVFASVITIKNPTHILAFAVLGVLVADFLGGLLLRPSLEVVRSAPDKVAAGAVFKIRYAVRNRRRLSAWDVVFDENLEAFGVRWPSGCGRVGWIPPRGKVEFEVDAVLPGRGRFRLPGPLAFSSFPFGIFKTDTFSPGGHEIVAHPRHGRLRETTFLKGRRDQRQGSAMVAKVGDSMEFMSCREFRTGDDPKHIHWPSTARASELIVREYQEEFLSRVALILDTFAGRPGILERLLGRRKKENPVFEAAVSLAASVSDSLCGGDLIVDVFAAGPEVFHFQAGRGLGTQGQILDILAGLAPGDKPLRELEPSVMLEVSGVGAAVVILTGWDEERRGFVKSLMEARVETAAVLVSEKDAETGMPNVSVARPEDITSGKFDTI